VGRRGLVSRGVIAHARAVPSPHPYFVCLCSDDVPANRPSLPHSLPTSLCPSPTHTHSLSLSLARSLSLSPGSQPRSGSATCLCTPPRSRSTKCSTCKSAVAMVAWCSHLGRGPGVVSFLCARTRPPRPCVSACKADETLAGFPWHKPRLHVGVWSARNPRRGWAYAYAMPCRRERGAALRAPGNFASLRLVLVLLRAPVALPGLARFGASSWA